MIEGRQSHVHDVVVCRVEREVVVLFAGRASLGQIDLHEQLAIICHVLNAQHEHVTGQQHLVTCFQ